MGLLGLLTNVPTLISFQFVVTRESSVVVPMKSTKMTAIKPFLRNTTRFLAPAKETVAMAQIT